MTDPLFTALRRLSGTHIDELLTLLAVMDPAHWPKTPDTVYMWANVATRAIEGSLAASPTAQAVMDKLQACGLMDQIWRLGVEGDPTTLATPRSEDGSPVLGRLFKSVLKTSRVDWLSEPENAVWFTWVQRGLQATPPSKWETQWGGIKGLELLWFLEQNTAFDALLAKGVVNLHAEPVEFLHKLDRPKALWAHLLARMDVNGLGKNPTLVEAEEPLWLRLAHAPAKGDPNKGLCEQVRAWATHHHPVEMELLRREEYFDALSQAGRRSPPRETEEITRAMHTALTARPDWRTLIHPHEPGQNAVWFAVESNACVVHALPEDEPDLWSTKNHTGQDLWFAMAQSGRIRPDENEVLARHLQPQPDAQGNGWWCALQPNWFQTLSVAPGCTWVRDHARFIVQGTPEAQKAVADHLWSGAWPWQKDEPNQYMAELCQGLVAQGVPSMHPSLQTFLAAWAVGSAHPEAPKWTDLLAGQGVLELPEPGKAWDNTSGLLPTSLWHPNHSWHERIVSAFRGWNAQVLAPVQPRARPRLRS